MRRAFRHLYFLAAVYAAGILFQTCFRLLLSWANREQIADLPQKTNLLLKAFVMGFRFDTVVCGYVLALPLLALSLAEIFSWQNRTVFRWVCVWLVILFGALFFAGAADIPYFRYYYSRLTIAALNWLDYPGFMTKMVFGEKGYAVYFGVFLFSSAAFGYLVVKLKRAILDPAARDAQRLNGRRLILSAVVSMLACGILFIGIRGRIAQKSPIRTGTAYFSTYAFPNQLGLNPAFTFIQSWLEQRQPENRNLHLIDEAEALGRVRKYLEVGEDSTTLSPAARAIYPPGNPLRANVILVLMESMSAAKMGRYGNPHQLTPVLDSLAQAAWCFDRFYSDGTHTYNGIYATLFSMPVLLRRHPMKGTIIPQMTGLARTLGERGYQTIFFTTHDEQFDNMGGFLHANGFQRVISQKDYPRDKILSTLGVPDDYLLAYAIGKINELSPSHDPFFAALLTASDHGPYIIPKGLPFQPHSAEIHMQAVEYADWSIGKFLHLAAQQPWYDHTIFVFLADHGAVVGPTDYDMPLAYFHIPLIFFAPKILVPPRVFSQLGGQIDVFPTVMGLLNMEYVNNTLGVDLLKERRPYVYFTSDDKIGCLNDSLFFVHRVGGDESLYQYVRRDPRNYIAEYPQAALDLRAYAFSMLQTAQWMIENRKTN